MNEDCGYNPDWWREEKALSLERKSKKNAASSPFQLGDTFLIVTEGEVTEPVYFDLLLRELRMSSVQVIIEPGDHSDPRHVIRTAERLVKEQASKARKGTLPVNEPKKFNHVWAVIDTDVAVRNDFWNDVVQLAKARKVKLAHSTPCFEYWLLLHIVGFTTRANLIDGATAKAAVREALGRDYSTNEETAKAVIPTFFAKWPEAVGRAEKARQHHLGALTPAPANPSTEVDLLVRALNDSALLHLRKL